MPDDPTLFWIAALTGLGGFTAWLVRDYIAYIKKQASEDKSFAREVALKGVSTAEKAVEKVKS